MGGTSMKLKTSPWVPEIQVHALDCELPEGALNFPEAILSRFECRIEKIVLSDSGHFSSQEDT
jgi:hypothetical protein